MFGKKKVEVNTAQQDLDRLKLCMQEIMSGNYGEVDTESFVDTELAEQFNDMLFFLKKHNNNYVMRLNEAMSYIGDNSFIRDMIGEVNSQSDSIKQMQHDSEKIKDSMSDIAGNIDGIKNNTHRVIDTLRVGIKSINDSIEIVSASTEQLNDINDRTQKFKEKVEAIGDIIEVVMNVAEQSNLLALNASIEAARAGEAGRGFAIVAEQVRALSESTADSANEVSVYVEELRNSIDDIANSMKNTSLNLSDGNSRVEDSLKSINNMNDAMEGVDQSLNDIANTVNYQTDIVSNFTDKVEGISNSYDVLSKECYDTGVHLFKIGRYIDTSRNDLCRAYTKVTDIDWMHIFEVDHFVLMWRLYSNAVDFEHLRITQLNNPDKCKFAVWISRQTDPRILESKQLKEMMEAHNIVHKEACDSWYAKEDGDVEKALMYFKRCYDAYYVFKDKTEAMCDFLRSIGDGEETEIKVFGK